MFSAYILSLFIAQILWYVTFVAIKVFSASFLCFHASNPGGATVSIAVAMETDRCFAAAYPKLWNTEKVLQLIFRSSPWLSRPIKAAASCMTCFSTRNFFGLFHSNENWGVCRGRWVLHNGMPYDPIQGQSQGHKIFWRILIFSNFQNLSPAN